RLQRRPRVRRRRRVQAEQEKQHRARSDGHGHPDLHQRGVYFLRRRAPRGGGHATIAENSRTEKPSMTLKRPKGPAGTMLVLEHTSSILKDNPLRDPHVRKLGVWLPPQYDEGSKRRFPVLYDLVGFTGSG